MNLVDSCGWLEYFADGPNADFFAPVITKADTLIVPAICILEVARRFLQQRDEREAIKAIAAMRQGRVVDLDTDTALAAAKIGTELGLPLADSVIVATARVYRAVVWTQDAHFEGLDGVRYKAKR